MSLDDKVDQLSADFAEHRGEMRQFAQNMNNYVGAVNAKLTNHLEKHDEDLKESIKADKAAGRDTWKIVLSCAALLLGLIEAFRVFAK